MSWILHASQNAAGRFNPVIRAIYDRLVLAGLPKRITLVAWMSKRRVASWTGGRVVGESDG